jgi:hypothetical protein
VFLGYSSIYKGFKYHDPTTGRVYISRDVVFDEAIFPFEKLHDNAGRRLHKEISLLPPTVLNRNTDIGVNYTNDHVLNSPNVSVFPGEEVNLSQEQIAEANQAGSSTGMEHQDDSGGTATPAHVPVPVSEEASPRN